MRDTIGQFDCPAGAIEIVRATTDDVPAILNVQRDAAQLPRSMGFQMWTWLDRPDAEGIVEKHIAAGEFFMARFNDEPIGTFFIVSNDPSIWGERGDDGLAGYVHSLAVVRRMGGRGVGAKMLDFAEMLIAHRGKKLVRVDCMTPNPPLCAYYQRLGFRDCGIKHADGWSAQLYERTIADHGA